MNWREKIEALIAGYREYHERLDGKHETEYAHKTADYMQALLDVAVAGLAVYRELDGQGIESVYALEEKLMALDKLREGE